MMTSSTSWNTSRYGTNTHASRKNEVATEVDHLKQTLNVELTHRYTSRYQHELEIQADVALPANHGLQLSSISVGK